MSPIPPYVPPVNAADDVVYDNAVSGLVAQQVQAAIDEIVAGMSGGASGYVEDGVVASIFQSTVNTNVYTDIFAMELTLTGDNVNRMVIDFQAGDLLVLAGVANPCTLRIYNDTDAVAVVHAFHSNGDAVNKIEPTHMRAILDPFAGTKVFKAQMKRNGAGTVTINGNGDQPRVMTMTAQWAPPA